MIIGNVQIFDFWVEGPIDRTILTSIRAAQALLARANGTKSWSAQPPKYWSLDEYIKSWNVHTKEWLASLSDEKREKRWVAMRDYVDRQLHGWKDAALVAIDQGKTVDEAAAHAETLFPMRRLTSPSMMQEGELDGSIAKHLENTSKALAQWKYNAKKRQRTAEKSGTGKLGTMSASVLQDLKASTEQRSIAQAGLMQLEVYRPWELVHAKLTMTEAQLWIRPAASSLPPQVRLVLSSADSSASDLLIAATTSNADKSSQNGDKDLGADDDSDEKDADDRDVEESTEQDTLTYGQKRRNAALKKHVYDPSVVFEWPRVEEQGDDEDALDLSCLIRPNPAPKPVVADPLMEWTKAAIETFTIRKPKDAVDTPLEAAKKEHVRRIQSLPADARKQRGQAMAAWSSYRRYQRGLAYAHYRAQRLTHDEARRMANAAVPQPSKEFIVPADVDAYQIAVAETGNACNFYAAGKRTPTTRGGVNRQLKSSWLKEDGTHRPRRGDAERSRRIQNRGLSAKTATDVQHNPDSVATTTDAPPDLASDDGNSSESGSAMAPELDHSKDNHAVSAALTPPRKSRATYSRQARHPVDKDKRKRINAMRIKMQVAAWDSLVPLIKEEDAWVIDTVLLPTPLTFESIRVEASAYRRFRIALPSHPWYGTLTLEQKKAFYSFTWHSYQQYLKTPSIPYGTFIQLWLSPCFYCSDLTLTRHAHRMDRLIASGDHSLDNIVPCCAPCNLARGQVFKYEPELYVEHAAYVGVRFAQAEGRDLVVDRVPTCRGDRQGPESLGTIVGEYKRTALSKGRVWNLEIDDAKDLLAGACTYCGLPRCLGIDRVGNDEGYMTDNCVSCCRVCNYVKKTQKVSEFRERCIRIARRWGFLREPRAKRGLDGWQEQSSAKRVKIWDEDLEYSADDKEDGDFDQISDETSGSEDDVGDEDDALQLQTEPAEKDVEM